MKLAVFCLDVFCSLENDDDNQDGSLDDEATISGLLEHLPKPEMLRDEGFQMHPEEFEKVTAVVCLQCEVPS